MDELAVPQGQRSPGFVGAMCCVPGTRLFPLDPLRGKREESRKRPSVRA